MFPPLRPVANAIPDYLRARGASAYGDVFLTSAKGLLNGHSECGRTSTNISGYYAKAGVAARRIGFHAVRHALATRLLRNGMPFKTIADILGHRSIESTYIYTKVELEGLRQLAGEWPLFVWPDNKR